MSNLDDFFKKRDKKKKTTAKTKFPTLDTDELAKNLEATTVRVVEEADAEFQEVPSERVANVAENLDEEWKPFDSDENKDYTGLRINIQNWKDEDEENEFANLGDEHDKKTSCPWGAPSNQSKKSEDNDDQDKEETSQEPLKAPKTIASILAENTSAAAASQEPVPKVESTTSSTGAYIPPSMRARMQATEPAKPAPAPAESTSGRYVPPSMRNKPSEGSSSSYEIPTSSVNYRRANKAQPNINDCLEFPTLDAAGSEVTGDKTLVNTSEKFELAKKSARVEPKNASDSMINLQNKFTALSN